MAKSRASSTGGLSGMLPPQGRSLAQVVPIPPQYAWMQEGLEAWYCQGDLPPKRIRIAAVPRQMTAIPDAGKWTVRWVGPNENDFAIPQYGRADSVFPNRVDALQAMESEMRRKAESLVRQAAKIRQEISELLGGG